MSSEYNYIKTKIAFDNELSKMDTPIERMRKAGHLSERTLMRKANLLIDAWNNQKNGFPLGLVEAQVIAQISEIGREMVEINDANKNKAKNPFTDNLIRAKGLMLQGKKEEFDKLLVEIMAEAHKKSAVADRNPREARIYDVREASEQVTRLQNDFAKFAKVFPTIVKEPQVPSPPIDFAAHLREAMSERNPYLNSHNRYETLLAKNIESIRIEDEMPEEVNAFPQAKLYIQQAYIMFDALVNIKKGAPIQLDREKALANIPYIGQRALQSSDAERAIGDRDNISRAHAYMFMGKKAEFDALLKEMDDGIKGKKPEEVRKVKQDIGDLQKDFAEFYAELSPQEQAKLVTVLPSQKAVAAQPPKPPQQPVAAVANPPSQQQSATVIDKSSLRKGVIDKSSFEKVLNQYKTTSWFYFLLSCLGISNKRSATITALFTLLNNTPDDGKISRMQVERAIDTESNATTKSHRAKLFKEDYKDQKQDTSTDDVVSKLAREFNGPK